MTKAEAGQIGGLKTYRKYGKMYMSRLGKLGAKKTWSLYKLLPIGQTQYAMVYRETNQIKAIVNSDNFSWRME